MTFKFRVFRAARVKIAKLRAEKLKDTKTVKWETSVLTDVASLTEKTLINRCLLCFIVSHILWASSRPEPRLEPRVGLCFVLESRLALGDPLGINRPTFTPSWRSHPPPLLHQPLWERSRWLEVQNEREVDEEIKGLGRLRLCSSSLSKCKVEEGSRWIIPGHFQSQSEVSRVGRKRIHSAGHLGWKAAADDKQVSLEINQSA